MDARTHSGNNETLAPFTYDHFIKAINTFKNDMLKCYIERAIGIYCKLRGISVDPEKDGMAYADAFEASNYAIYIVSTKLRSYNPEKGEFKSYLDKALSNALKDILKEDKAGDFFDQTSKKKNKDDEPEKHTRVSVERYWGAGNESESDPNNAESEKEERIRRHQDDALEVMIKYIDSLPEMDRVAIYASAFGQVLRPDLENYGRDYAERVAEMYGKSAEYIRKIASIGKKNALAKANENGFNATSIKNFYLEFLQVRREAPSQDKVMSAVSMLNPFQRFMFMRHLVDMNDEEESLRRTILENIEKSKSYDPYEESRLRELYCRWRKEDLARFDYSNCHLDIELEHKVQTVICDRIGCPNYKKCRFKLGEYPSLLEMLDQMGIEVCTEPGIKSHPIPPELNESEDYWKKQVDMLRGLSSDKFNYQYALQKLKDIQEEKENWSRMLLRGCYISNKKLIILYPDAMKKESREEKIDALLVSTLVLQIMHAYFNRPGHENLPYLPFVEEPLAEFGMLLYLKETDKLKNFPDGTSDWFDWAYNDVKQKKTCHRFGADLMDRYFKEGPHSNLRHILEEYKTFNTKLIPKALMWWK